MLKHSFIVLGLCAAVFGPGCASSHEIKQGLTYPSTVKRGATLDIQVFRRETKIELTNSTARSFGATTLWLNGRFSRKIDGLAIGQTLTIPLREFKDEFGESFRGGGFFAAQKPELLALAEIESVDTTPPTMFGLVVVGNDEY